MKRLNISLTTQGSLNKAIEYLEQYKESLNEKTMRFIEELGNVGITALNARVNSISPFYKGEDLDVNLEIKDGIMGATITMSGDQCAFIEFGSGVLFNAPKGDSLHPKGKEFGYTIGSYNPDSPNAESPTGWWYYDEHGQKQHTYGTPTFAPLHNSEMEMINEIKSIFYEVFGNG